MAIQDIITEVKTMSSRQVLILVLAISLYLNFNFIKDNQTENLNYKLLEKERQETIDKVTESRVEDVKEMIRKSYEYERTIDSLKLINSLKK